MKTKYKDDLDGFSMAKTGIERERCCTDWPCLALFWAFIGAMVYATMYGYANGQVDKLTAPIDGANNFCGFGDYKDYKKMMLTSFSIMDGAGILRSGVCVKACPDKVAPLKEGEDCKGNANFQCSKHESYKTKDILDFCLPMSKSDLPEDD